MTKKERDLNFYDQIERDYSTYLIKKGDSDLISRISTGSLSLDVMTNGGIPMRKFTEIYGPEGVGKTTLALSIAKNAINAGYSVLYVDAEQAVDINFAEKIIENIDKFTLMQPEVLEDTLSLCESAIHEKLFNLIILDSIASMTPRKVIKETLEDSNPYILPKKLTLFVHRNAYALRNFDVAFIGINQVRDDTSNPYIRTFAVPGGHAWKHLCSLRIQLNRSDNIVQGDAVLGISTRFIIKKSKVSPPYRTGNIPIMFGDGYAYIDFYRDVVDLATILGILIKSGAYYKYEDITLGRGMNNAIEYLKNSSDTLDSIIQMCYNIVNRTSITDDDV